MVDVNESLADFTVSFLEFEVADVTPGPIFCQASMACRGITLVSIHFHFRNCALEVAKVSG